MSDRLLNILRAVNNREFRAKPRTGMSWLWTVLPQIRSGETSSPVESDLSRKSPNERESLIYALHTAVRQIVIRVNIITDQDDSLIRVLTQRS